MHTATRTVLASLILLAYAMPAHAASTVVDNLTLYANTKVSSPQEALRQNAARFGLPPSLNNLVRTRVQESLTGTHYTYQQMLRGLPVERSEIIVSIGKNGQLLKIFNETRHISAEVEARAINQLHNKQQMNAEQLLDTAWANMKVQHPLVSLPTSQLVWLTTKDGVQLARKVSIEAQMPTGGFVQYLDAHDGKLLYSNYTSLPRNIKGG